MKRLHYILTLMLLLLAFSAHGQTHVYERYAKLSNLEVAYLKNFPVDSNTHVNITVIIAKNKIAWRWLLKDLNLFPIKPEIKKQLSNGNISTKNILRNYNNPSEPPSPILTNNCLLSIMYHTHTITIYHITTKEQYLTILNYSLKNIINEKD